MQENTQKLLTNRLNRIAGQIGGLTKMITENKYCVDIITQSLAIQKSLQSFNQAMLENHLHEHASQQLAGKEHNKAVKELVKIYSLSNK